MPPASRQPGAPLFALDPAALASAFAADPALPGTMEILPGPVAAAAFLLDTNEWLRRYDVSLV